METYKNGEDGADGSNLAEMILYKSVESAILIVKGIILNVKAVILYVKAIILNEVSGSPLFFLFSDLGSLCFPRSLYWDQQLLWNLSASFTV